MNLNRLTLQQIEDADVLLIYISTLLYMEYENNITNLASKCEWSGILLGFLPSLSGSKESRNFYNNLNRFIAATVLQDHF